MQDALIYFVTGGFMTSAVVLLEESSWRTASGFAILLPTLTLISYFFIGQSLGGAAIAQNAKFVLWGTLFTWLPYMLAIIYLAPRMSPNRAIGTSLMLFFILATIYISVVHTYGWFQ